jgi:8-amino-7-oxononanoate synthase
MSNFTEHYRKRSTIISRVQDDSTTKARLEYGLWYQSFEKDDGAHVWCDGREMIMLSSNDYLGLSRHPKVLAAGEAALNRWGSSTNGARLANGSRSIHFELEEQLADFLGRDSCMVLSAGYLACMASVSSFAQKGDLILVDRNVHSSLWSGIKLSDAKVERFAHNNPIDLQDILQTESLNIPKMIVLEGVYSMEGHIAQLPEIIKAAKDHNCFIVVDDAHGLGVLGDRGQGTVHHFDCNRDIDVLCGSLSKSLASTGGFVSGSRDVIEYLKTHSKLAIFSAAISPVQAACAQAALNVLITEPEHRIRLWDNTRYYKSLLHELNVDIWNSDTPAVPIVIGSMERAIHIWKTLMDEGVFSVLAVAPAVPPGKDLIRTAISARHTREDIERSVEALAKALKRF